MPRFLLRRLIGALITLWVVITASFFMMRAAPGGPFDSDRRLPPEIRRNVEAKLHLDEPLFTQYARYLSEAVRGDFGPSLKYRDKRVIDILVENYPVSLRLGLTAIIIATAAGGCLGVLAALRQNRPIDSLTVGIAAAGVSIPSFVTGPLLQWLFGSTLGILPIAGWDGGAAENMILPVVVLALPQIAVIARLTRAGMIEALRSNYVRTARAKGLSEARIVARHALRAGVLPLISYLGPACAGLLTGSLVVERIFNLPGLGKFFVVSALQRDYPVVMAMVIVYASLILILNLAADLVQATLDPQARAW